MSTETTPMTEQELLDELSALADEIEVCNAERDRLYARRRELFIDGRSRTPPIGTRILGDAARCSDVLVTNSVKEKRK